MSVATEIINDVARPGSVNSRFVGRRAESERLTALLDVQSGLASGATRALLLDGDAGVGKTRLLGELADTARSQGWTVAVGHCLDFGDSALPYLPFSEVVGRLIDELPRETVSQVLQAYEHAGGSMTEERGNATASSGGHSHSSSGHDKAGVHDKQAHETSKAFVSKASTMYSKVKRLAPKDSVDEMAKVKAGLTELRNAVSHHDPVDKVTVIVHGKIHDNLIKAFDLKLPAEEEEEKEHGHDEGDHMKG